MSSQAVLERALTGEKLESDQELYKPRTGSIRASLRNWFGGFFAGFEPEQIVESRPIDVVIDELKERHFWVERSGNTYLVDVAVLSEDPPREVPPRGTFVMSGGRRGVIPPEPRDIDRGSEVGRRHGAGDSKINNTSCEKLAFRLSLCLLVF